MHFKALCASTTRACGITKQTLLIMKLTVIFLFIACLQVQANGYAQTVTLSEKKAPLLKIFREIHKQTGFKFFYEEEVLNQAGKN